MLVILCSVFPMCGTITLEAEVNTSTTSRSATVTVTGGGVTRTISVTQDGITGNDNALAQILIS